MLDHELRPVDTTMSKSSPRTYRGQERQTPATGERSLSASVDKTSLRPTNVSASKRDIVKSAKKTLSSGKQPRSQHVQQQLQIQQQQHQQQQHQQQQQFKKKLSVAGRPNETRVSSASKRKTALQVQVEQPSTRDPNRPLSGLTQTGLSIQRGQTYTVKSARPHHQRMSQSRSRPSSTSTTSSKLSSRGLTAHGLTGHQGLTGQSYRPTTSERSSTHASHLSYSSSSRASQSKPTEERKHWFELPNPILPKLPPKGACLSTIIETSHHNLQQSPTKDSNPYMTALLTSISTIWRKKQLYDVVLAIGPHRLGAHKIILAASSEYFYELFTREEDNQEEEQFMYTLKGIQFETMRMLLESMYTCYYVVTSENVERILNAATYLRIPSALDACSNFLIQNLNISTCLVTIALAQVFELSDVADKACKLAAKHFLQISEMEEFLDLTEGMLLMLIRRDDLDVESELQVFEALLRWIDVDRENRLAHAEKLLENIRLPLIKPPDLVDHVESVNFLMDIPPCEALVKEALHYHCLPQRQAVLQSCRTTPRSSVKTTTMIALGGHPRRAKDPVSSQVEYYNPVDRKWKTLTHMKQPRHHHAGRFEFLSLLPLISSSSKAFIFASHPMHCFLIFLSLKSNMPFHHFHILC